MGLAAEKKSKEGPPSRAEKVHKTAMEIERIINNADSNSTQTLSRNGRDSLMLNDVCDAEGQLHEVMQWSREEARAFVESYRKLLLKKQESKNETSFVEKEV